MMRRREIIGLIGSGAMSLSLPAKAQQAQIPVIGFLSSRSPAESAAHTAAFRRGLMDSDYIEGKNVAIEYRWAEGQYDRLPTMASELLALPPAVVVAGGGSPSALAAKAATSIIPIVFLIGEDPVKAGLVASFNRPGGNLTGVSFLTGELGAKRLGLLCELARDLGAVGLLLNPNNPDGESQRQNVQRAAGELGRRLHVVQASTPAEFESIFKNLVQEQVKALVVENDPFFDSQRAKLIELTARHAIPAIYHIREFPAAGGLMSYGASLLDAYRVVGNYTGRILKGEKAAEMPIMQPTEFELIVNLKAAKALGLEVPATLLARTDAVIE